MRNSPDISKIARRRAWSGWLALLLSAGLFLLWAHGTRGVNRASGEEASVVDAGWSRAEWEAWSREEVEPALADAELADARAVDRALVTVHEAFEGFRRGVPAFCDDLASWGTRAGVVKRTVRGWVSGGGKASIESYAREKFEQHVVPPGSVHAAIAQAAGALAQDLEANRNVLRARLDAALARSVGSAAAHLGEVDGARARFEETVQEALGAHAGASVGSGLAAFMAGAAGSVVAEQAVAQVLARVGVGAAAGAAGAGGGAGAAAGPVGVAVGLGVGLAVGAGIDWWMTERFKERVAGETLAYLDGLEGSVVDGSDGAPGIRAGFVGAVDEAGRMRREALARAIEEAAR